MKDIATRSKTNSLTFTVSLLFWRLNAKMSGSYFFIFYWWLICTKQLQVMISINSILTLKRFSLVMPLKRKRNRDGKWFISSENHWEPGKAEWCCSFHSLFAPQTAIKISTASSNTTTVFRFNWGPACKVMLKWCSSRFFRRLISSWGDRSF